MRLYEHEAKAILSRYGIAVPRGTLVTSPEQAFDAAEEIGKPVMVKAQVLVGGRGKAGGILSAENPEKASEVAASLLGRKIGGEDVRKLLVEERLEMTSQFYVGVTVDSAKGCPVAMISSRGGIDIEEAASSDPKSLVTASVNVLEGFREYQARSLARTAGIEGVAAASSGLTLWRLFQIFRTYDAELAEINPFVETTDGRFVAADARLNIDDHALFRHPEIDSMRDTRAEGPLEREARMSGVNFVDLSGEVAIMGNGAGLVMTMLDMVKRSGEEPACFLDTGGGASKDRVHKALNLLFMKARDDPRVKAILFTLSLMITPAEEATEGIIEAMKNAPSSLPVYGVIHGTGSSAAQLELRESGVKLFERIEDAIQAISQITRR
jgi:succinyl-CoA synthetase beta subunit